MFNLDIKLFNLLYSYCKSLGGVFYLGAFEGAILYSGVILLAIIKATEKKTKK